MSYDRVAVEVLPRRLRFDLQPPQRVWATSTASAATYDRTSVLRELNAVAKDHGAPQQRAVTLGQGWWPDPLVWQGPGWTLCAFTDPDGTDLHLVAWGEGAEATVEALDGYLRESE